MELSSEAKGAGADCGLTTDALTTEISKLDETISHQEKEIESKWASIAERKAHTKERISGIFTELKRIMERKEREANDRVETHFDKLRAPLLDPSVVNVTLDKARVNTMLRNDFEQVKSFSADIVMQSLSDLKKDIIKRDQVLNGNREPILTIEEDLKEKFEQWHCVSETLESATVMPEANIMIGTNLNSESERDGRLLDSATGIGNGAVRQSGKNMEKSHESEQKDTKGRQGGLSTNIQPSAPPLEVPNAGRNTSEDREAPPSYWQALGMSGSQTGNAPTAPELNLKTYPDAAPRYNDAAMVAPTSRGGRSATNPSNYLDVWHSFAVRREYGSGLVIPSSLSWNEGYLCLGDRKNKRITFFDTYGEPRSAMTLEDEIHDVGFIEKRHNESRYVVSLAKIFAVYIIALKPDLTTMVVKKFTIRDRKPYNCICKGPEEQTFVGGSGLPSGHTPSVDIIDSYGIVKRSFKKTPDSVPFAFPKSVYVINQFIIISDWKLNVVCVFCSDGTPVGQYGGVPHTPLTDPADITMDHYGNIMVLDGHLPNVHVIDLKCTPIEILKLPEDQHDSRKTGCKCIAFDANTKILAAFKSNGQLEVYSFRGGYKGIPQYSMVDLKIDQTAPRVLPYVEGMLPNTIENMRGGSRPRGGSGVNYE